jgi:hypothetical protein
MVRNRWEETEGKARKGKETEGKEKKGKKQKGKKQKEKKGKGKKQKGKQNEMMPASYISIKGDILPDQCEASADL